ncbi:MAG: hypothetical protein WAU01_15685 [Saprospiraceae bacterium]
MQRVSSNLTLFLKLFIPTTWIVFFTVFTAALFMIDDKQLPFLTSPVFKYPFLLVYIIFFLLLYFTVIQLKRIELGPEFYIATNYFKTYRLSYQDIRKVSILGLGPWKIVKFGLAAKSSFGKNIVFLADSELYDLFLHTNPDVQNLLKELEE